MSTMAKSLRSMVLLPLAATWAACVVPVGPDWIDPEGNSPPTIRSADPPVGTILTRVPETEELMTVTVGLADRNTKDTLHIRFIIDYPPFDAAASRIVWRPILPGNGEVERPPLIFRPNCADHTIASGPPASHRLLLAVSDRPFEDHPTALDQVPNGNYLVEAVWPFELECP